jgi:hypothetical protein
MDPFDFIPIVPPQLPGERSARTPGEQAAAFVGLGILPLASGALVLFTGVRELMEVVLVALPLLCAMVAYVVGRRLGSSFGQTILVSFGSATACFIGNLGALLLAALGSFYSNF